MIVSVAPRPAAGAAQPEDPAQDGADDQEEQDHRLEDVDQLGRDPGLDLHQAGAGAHRPEQQRREKMIPNGLDRAEQRDRDRVEADRRPEASSSSGG